MGFGAPVIGALNIAYSNGCFTGMESVCDLGNQELGWSGHTFLLLDFPYSSFPPLDRRLNDDEKKLVGSMSTSDLYRKIGFAPVGLRRDYYQADNEDAIIMTLENLQQGTLADRLSEIELKLPTAVYGDVKE